MGVTVRQKHKGRGNHWYVFVHQNKTIRSKSIGDKKQANASGTGGHDGYRNRRLVGHKFPLKMGLRSTANGEACLGRAFAALEADY